MKYGILSDIHGNLEALEAALARLQGLGAEQYIFCGDLVGYGPDPEACVQRYIALHKQGKAIGVMGNHDAVFTEPYLLSLFNLEAQISLRWSAEQLSLQSQRALSSLPLQQQKESFCVLHGSPRSPITEYFTTVKQYHLMEQLWQGQVLFVGHTHVAFYIAENKGICEKETVVKERVLVLRPGQRYLINPGSVGLSRDANLQASFALWDTQQQTVSFLRTGYEVERTQEKMKKAGFPQSLIRVLAPQS